MFDCNWRTSFGSILIYLCFSFFCLFLFVLLHVYKCTAPSKWKEKQVRIPNEWFWRITEWYDDVVYFVMFFHPLALFSSFLLFFFFLCNSGIENSTRVTSNPFFVAFNLCCCSCRCYTPQGSSLPLEFVCANCM